MSNVVPVPLLPGGMLSDRIENQLGESQYQRVVNLRQVKIGEWQNTPGYKNILTGFTNIKIAVEVTEDESNDRFILLQDGTDLKRVDYDLSNSPTWGYENESASTLTLPSGVTIGADDVLRFHIYRGIVRISGASEPMWYGYTERTLFDHNIESQLELTFESTNESFSGTAAVARDNTYAKSGSYSLKITQSSSGQYARRTFTCLANTTYRLELHYLADPLTTPSVGQTVFKVGSSLGGTEHGSKVYYGTDTTDDDDWVSFVVEFTTGAAQSTYYLEIVPSTVASRIAYIDKIIQYIVDDNTIDLAASWRLTKAALSTQEMLSADTDDILLIDYDAGNDELTYHLREFNKYDDAQYTLMQETPFLSDAHKCTKIGLPVLISGSNLQSTWDKYRLTAFYIALAESNLRLIDATKEEWNVVSEIDLTDNLETIYYLHTGLYAYGNSNGVGQHRIYFTSWSKSDGFMKVGDKITLENSNGSVQGWITHIELNADNQGIEYIEIGTRCSILWGHASTDADIEPTTIKLERYWTYDSSTGYSTSVAINLADELDYQNLTGISKNAESISPDYNWHVITEERAYVASREDGEKDIIRYSPIYQFDVFPDNFIMQTEVGDTDEIKTLVIRDGRVTALKRNSLSQGGYLDGRYSEDVGIAKMGIVSDNGFVLVGKTLYYVGKEDLYSFVGIEPKPVLKSQELQLFYKQYINSASLLLYDQLNDEIWMLLNGRILISNPKRSEWYEKETDITPVCGFVDADQKLIICSSTAIVSYEHSETSFDENIRFYVKSRLFDDRKSKFYLKFNESNHRMKCNKDIEVKITDPEEDTTGRTARFTPSSTKVSNNEVRKDTDDADLKYLFKQLELEIYPIDSYNDLNATIREQEIEVERWRR